MLLKKFWIPVLLVLIGVAIGVTFWEYQQVASQAPVKIISPVTADPVDTSKPATPKPPPPGETYESGHWHGEEWHAEPHEPVIAEEVPFEDGSFEEIVDPDLADFTDEELATYERVRRNQVIRHQQKYPDCQDYEAVWEDADRHAKWWVGYKKWSAESDKRYEEWKKVLKDQDEFFDDLYLNMSPEERMAFLENMSDAEKASLVAELEDWDKREAAAYKRYDEFKQEKPVEPKRRHTH
ncbi:MAG: hypothetical protein OXG97_02800 [Candidatus Poribacteria bacterium]|nr:hypothetical protein [Candidatus Poribacteria bacterium]